MEIPSFYIDVPYEKNYDSVMYVAKQLRELKNFYRMSPEEKSQRSL